MNYKLIIFLSIDNNIPKTIEIFWYIVMAILFIHKIIFDSHNFNTIKYY